MKEYTNSITISPISKVITHPDEIQIEVYFRDEESKIFGEEQIADFLNKNKFSIGEELERGIFEDFSNFIGRHNDRYYYEEPYEAYNTLFRTEGAIAFDLNDSIPDMVKNIDKGSQLSNRLQEIIGFDPEEGLCHALNYFMVFMGLKYKEDFIQLSSHTTISESVSSEDFVDCIDENQTSHDNLMEFDDGNFHNTQDSSSDSVIYYEGKIGCSLSEQKRGAMLIVQNLVEYIPLFDAQSMLKREGFDNYQKHILHEDTYDFSISNIKRNKIDCKRLKDVLDKVEIGHYLELNFSSDCYYKEEDSDDGILEAHSLLIYKRDEKEYSLIDSNRGVVGFGLGKRTPSLTPEAICKIAELAINYYAFHECTGKSTEFPERCEVFFTLKNATHVLKELEGFYENNKDPKSKIVEISVAEHDKLTLNTLDF